MQETMNRFDKVEYLMETCCSEFIQECNFLNELVAWMNEDEFNAFYDRVCSMYDIMQPDELDKAMACDL